MGYPSERLARRLLILLSSQVHLRWKSGSCVSPLWMLESKSERLVSFDFGAEIATCFLLFANGPCERPVRRLVVKREFESQFSLFPLSD